MKINTSRFGEIEISEDKIFTFPEGILGFSQYSRYAFIKEDGCEPFKIMQSVDNPSLAFIIIDPMSVRPDYTIEISKTELEFVETENSDDLVVYVIVTMANKLEDTTINLQGPLLINPAKKICQQFVVYDDRYSTKEPLLSTMAINKNWSAKTQAG